MQSVGIKCFIKYYDLFSSGRPGSDLVIELQEAEGWTTTGCRTRVNCSRRIIADPTMRTSVLEYVAYDARRVDKVIRDRAIDLLSP